MFKSFFGSGNKSSSADDTQKSQPTTAESTTAPSQTSTTSPSDSIYTQTETVSDMLNGLSGIDASVLHPVAAKSPSRNKDEEDDAIEYLFIDENPFMKPQERPAGSFGPLPMRTQSDKLLYGTGALYLMGLSSGGAYGFYRGLKTARGRTFKLRLNSVLNQVTRYGPMAGNSMGVIGTYTDLYLY
ncbi:Mitochondrial import inner membrane translocase subunit tim23 [Quaeritorhiza haematococci]|nr:Mitochondrial import inner membrane translocase subunit tim23 [Quaeritorhiza haematococci]